MPITEPIQATNMLGGTEFIQAIFLFVIFCGLSLLGQASYPFFGLATLLGIAYPLAWGRTTGRWAEMGFTGQNIRQALLWGVLAAIPTSIIGVAVLPELSVPPRLGMQLLIGVPMWMLIASPFQEFFFRGYMQSRFVNRLGGWWGVLLANGCFTLWHYFAPFAGNTMVPLETPVGVLSTFGAGLFYAYAFHRTQNIISPWLAHVVTGITFIIVGAMDFTQPLF